MSIGLTVIDSSKLIVPSHLDIHALQCRRPHKEECYCYCSFHRIVRAHYDIHYNMQYLVETVLTIYPSSCVGNSIGAQVFQAKDAPRYIPGIIVCASMYGVEFTLMGIWRTYCKPPFLEFFHFFLGNLTTKPSQT